MPFPSPEAFAAFRLDPPAEELAAPWPSRLLMNTQPSVQYIGSRELHRDLPKVLDSLVDSQARIVLTIHSKPRAVLIGAEAFQELLRRTSPADQLLALQLGALVQGLGAPIDEVSSIPDSSLTSPGQLSEN